MLCLYNNSLSLFLIPSTSEPWGKCAEWVVTKKAWNCQALTGTPLALLGAACAGSSGGRHSPGLSLACDHGQITKPLHLVGTGSEAHLPDHPHVTHWVNSFGHPLPHRGSTRPHAAGPPRLPCLPRWRVSFRGQWQTCPWPPSRAALRSNSLGFSGC